MERVPPFETRRINSWPFFWQEEFHRPSSRNCARWMEDVLLSTKGYRFFPKSCGLPGDDALVTEIQQTMEPLFTVQDLTLYRYR